MVGERRLGGDKGLQIVVAVLAPAAAHARPFGIGRRRVGARARRGALRRRPGRHCPVRVPRRSSMSLRLTSRSWPSQSPGLRDLGRRFCRLRLSGPRRVALRHALQQRIALELAVDIGNEIQVRELQQLDGLHQLRRHHERLALPDFKSLRQRHWYFTTQHWPVSCLYRYRAGVHPCLGTVVNSDWVRAAAKFGQTNGRACPGNPAAGTHHIRNSSPR